MNCTRLIVTAAVIAVGQVAAKEPTLQDYEILGALVAGDAIHAVRGPVYVWHLIEPLSAISPGGIKSALSFFPEARPTASVWESEPVELDVHRLNAVIDSSPYRFIKPLPVKLLDRSPVQPSANQGPAAIWFVSPVVVPSADSIIRLTRPVIREDGRVAFVVFARCDKWSGSVVEQELDKDPVSGRWRLGQSGRRDFTRWEDGGIFEYRGPKDLKSSSDCH
jgi:hypothetical protein